MVWGRGMAVTRVPSVSQWAETQRIAFGRGIGDAASVLFTAGFTDRVPASLADPAATLPLAIFFQLGTPFPEVQQRAYASAAVLTLIILVISLAGRAMSRKATRHVVK